MSTAIVNSKKINLLQPADRGQPAAPASMSPPPANDTNGFAAGSTLADRAAESAPPLYLEDLADFDEFDFGGAALGVKARAAIASATSGAEKSLIPDRPLNARDLSRQRSATRLIEARPLPLPLRVRRAFRGAAGPPVAVPPAAVHSISGPAVASAGSKKINYIEARPLPLRPRRKQID
jgi:hypothetical protein